MGPMKARLALRRPSTEGLVSFVVVGAAVAFILAQLSPSLILRDTTVAGGDTGAHVWGPAYLRDHLLPHLRLSGWAPDWYAGFPAYTFYFPLPALAVVVLDVVLPYNIALKLVTVLGVLGLPIALYAFGRLMRLAFPVPAVLAVATVPFLFDRGFSIYGGNIASTLAGEFSFSIALALAFLFLGVFARMLETGERPALAAVLLAATALSHAYPTLFALAGAFVLFLFQPGRRRLVRGGRVLVVAGLLVGFWALPLVWRLPYANSMYYERVVDYTGTLFPSNLRWLLVLAGVGLVFSVVNRIAAGQFIALMASLSALAFAVAPDGHLWNPRFVPFWFLCLYLLAGIAVAELGRVVARAYAPEDRPGQPRRGVLWATPGVAAVVTWVFVGLPLGLVPKFVASTDDRSFVASWARWNYSGYEAKSAYPEHRQIIDAMTQVGKTNGCGRAHWEYQQDRLGSYGTPLALMLLPYWTDGCIGSMEGLYFESSATTPYHFLSASELSAGASRPMRRLPYSDFDIDAGVEHLQVLGVRYYMAFTPEAVAAADAQPDLRLVRRAGDWRIYEVAGSELVEPLVNEPAVVTGLGRGTRPWLDVAVNWFDDPGAQDVFLAAGGPPPWSRVPLETRPASTDLVGEATAVPTPPARPLPPVEVSGITVGDEGQVAFDVDRVGVPVLVKVSYFPNWQADGADGPWRVAPNLMVVVPTESHVELRYGTTPVDLGGWALTLVGIAGAVVLVRRPEIGVPAEPAAVSAVPDEGGDREGGEGEGGDGAVATGGAVVEPSPAEPAAGPERAAGTEPAEQAGPASGPAGTGVATAAVPPESPEAPDGRPGRRPHD